MSNYITLILCLAALPYLAVSQCLDEDGKAVDWFVAIKFPKLEHNQNLDTGLSFASLTSKNAHKGFQLSSKAVSDPMSLMGRTLSPIYDPSNNNTAAKLLYNDELPNGKTSFTDGHTKGVVYFGGGVKGKGFWLVHSVPHYPPDPSESKEYGYPHTGLMYGQSFLCLSLDTAASADQLGGQLMFNHPYLYGVNMPKEFEAKYPKLALAAQKKHVKTAPFSNVAAFTSFPSKNLFLSFAKTTDYGKDLYADLVAPALRTGLYVETWPNGKGKMTSRCDTYYQVMNVDGLFFKGIGNYTTTHDHAKWAISISPKSPVVCIGDINRMNSQMKRAGGTVCFVSKVVYKAFWGVISELEGCPRVSRKDGKKVIKRRKKGGYNGTV